jgi:UDP-3-O-[3-hydroxymyristoyl] N-acetylglucosamine deacetylase
MQTTIKKAVKISGQGLHTGGRVHLALRPAPAHSGIRFRRTDLNDFEIEATKRYIAKVSYATTLMKRGVMIATVEHLLSALYGLGVHNVIVELDAMEIPIMDGSAAAFVGLIREAGIVTLEEPAEYLRIIKPIEIRQGAKFIAAYPDHEFRISYEIDFPHPLIGNQCLNMAITSESYRRQIAPARTFGFYDEIQQLMKSGLIRGGSFDNAIVLDRDGIMNEDPRLRYTDEFVRHKILDLIGDISLVGKRILGHLHAVRGGHALHAALAGALLKSSDAYEILRCEATVSAQQSR